jgi:hypothetical protein
MSTIHVLYSCKLCGIVKRSVAVPNRHESQDVVSWVQGTVLHRVMLDHTRTSLLCEAETVDLYLPAPKDARFIGEKDNPPQTGDPT